MRQPKNQPPGRTGLPGRRPQRSAPARERRPGSARRPRRAAVLGALAAATACGLLGTTASVATPASADQVDPGTTGSGYSVAVTFTGDAAPPSGGGAGATVQPSCWWAPATGPYDDAAGMLDWYDQNAAPTGALPGYSQSVYGPRSDWEDAAKQQKAGTKISWYRATCRNPADYATFNAGSTPGTQFALTLYRAFAAGTPIPPPLVRSRDLVEAARKAMVILPPEVRRNPALRSAGAPTIVGLATWFWVRYPAAVGGATGVRTITAHAGNVSATLTATTTGLQISSPVGGTLCSPSRATVRYADGVPESSACTLVFKQASVAYPKGYPVTTSTGWDATWTGSDGDGGPVPGGVLTRTATVDVPVAEVQNVVTGPGSG